MGRRRQKGLALVLVMTVILALAIIATPFVLSMLLQERCAQAARCQSQAGYSVDGSGNFGQWAMMNGVDPMERRFPTAPFDSYYFDSINETQISVANASLPAGSVLNPKGSIWGVSVQDEQGKLNLRTAPQAAVDRLRERLKDKAVNPRDYITIYSGRDARWIYPQRIRGIGSVPDPEDPDVTLTGLSVDVASHYGPGAILRVSKPGLSPMTVEVATVEGKSVGTRPAVPGQYADGMVEVEARHPVNVNTARPETLMAILQDLDRPGVLDARVTPDAAARAAFALAGGRVTRWEDFRDILAGLDLSPEQKATIGVNAIDPTRASLQGTGTVPFCFKTYDVYTIESYASQNNPAGAQVAGRGAREVVSVSPPISLSRTVESQFDFDSMYCFGLVLRRDDSYVGYPFGNRLLSFPGLTSVNYPTAPLVPSDVTLESGGQAAGSEAYITIVPARDFRGELDRDYRNRLQRWEHYDDKHEGHRMAGPLTYSWDRVFLTHPLDPSSPDKQWPSVTEGGIEMWVRFDGPIKNPQTIFDIRESQTNPSINRLSLEIRNTFLVLTACDSTEGIQPNTIDNGAAQIWQPFNPAQKTWYHIGAYWKGNHYTGLALLVDGFAHPQQKFRHCSPEELDQEGQTFITRLTAPLNDTTTNNLPAGNVDWLPNEPTPLRIGSEVVVYDRSGMSAVPLSRGQRGTNPTIGANYQENVGKSHPLKAPVTVFGYSSKLRKATLRVTIPNTSVNFNLDFSRLKTGDARIFYRIGPNPRATLVGDKQDNTNPTPVPVPLPGGGQQWYIDDTQKDIYVNADPTIMDFPDQGYIRIVDNEAGDEVIFYEGRVEETKTFGGRTANGKFTGCHRTDFKKGTVAKRHNSPKRVEMWCVPVTNTNNFPNPAIIQVGPPSGDEEWFGPVWVDTEKPNYWIPYDGQNLMQLLRGQTVFGSRQMEHQANLDEVRPTFVVCDSEDKLQNLGRWDRITLLDEKGYRERARVRRVSHQNWKNMGAVTNVFNIQNGGNNAQIVGLWDAVKQEFVADDLHVRALKFPSGELMSLTWLNTNPSFTIGDWEGMIDEVKFFGRGRRDVEFGAACGEQDLQATLRNGGPVNGGLFKAGDDYIGYGNRQNDQLSILKRGWLCSTAQVHDEGDRVMDLSGWIPVSALLGDVTAEDKEIPIAQRLVADDREGQREYRRGYVLIDDEVILYEWGNRNRASGPEPLKMPVRWDGKTGLFRGMFGTQPAQHPANRSLVYGMPWRFWDTYKQNEFDSKMVYFQWSTQMDLARWMAFNWKQEIPEDDPNIVVHARVRVDGKGDLSQPGVNDDSIVLEFQKAGGPINRIGYQNDAGQLDVRFLVEYRKGSFDPTRPWETHSWKRAPKIKKVEVTYDRPSKTLYHEER